MLRREPERPREDRASRSRRARRRGRAARRGRAGVRAAARLARRDREGAGRAAYVIFHDATLREIATQAPATLAELGTISGVGENKLAKYGQGVLEAVAGD